jgi:hypothetical protein
VWRICSFRAPTVADTKAVFLSLMTSPFQPCTCRHPGAPGHPALMRHKISYKYNKVCLRAASSHCKGHSPPEDFRCPRSLSVSIWPDVKCVMLCIINLHRPSTNIVHHDSQVPSISSSLLPISRHTTQNTYSATLLRAYFQREKMSVLLVVPTASVRQKQSNSPGHAEKTTARKRSTS